MTIAPEALAILPLIWVIALAILVVVVDMAWPGRERPVAVVALVGILIGIGLAVAAGGNGTIEDAFGGAYRRDSLTTFLDVLFLGIGLLTILFSPDYLRARDYPLGEYIATLLFAISGAMLIGGAHDLLVLFLGLELLVLPGYMLVAYAKRDGLATEGAIKYFLLGSFSSAIFLFGLAFTWGLTGSTRTEVVAQALERAASGGGLSAGLAMGLALMTTGVCFKIAAVPFHYWTPDAYQGSPTPVTAYLSTGPKAAAFALIIRLFAQALAPVRADWVAAVVIISAITMTLGNLVALTQDNIKRMLAYSSIAHTGYILVGLAAFAGAAAGSPAARAGIEGILFYLAAYAVMNLGAFAVVAALQSRPGVTSQISTFAGLGRREPFLGALMMLFLLSLTGIPPLAGFFAKAYVITAALQVGGWVAVLAVLTVLNAAMAAFYYLRVVVVMYMQDAPANAQPVRNGAMMRAGLILAAVGTIIIGLIPGLVIPMAQAAASAIH
ncbi:MAG: NADH-quinone oxidoreductase subunit N [Chloroflexota bacterium]|nr:MAG: NADH-quinone oxidoreductase subunit N [Chloroflexota bacterium]